MTTARPGKWLAREPRDDSRMLLFCLPFTGTGAGLLRQWPQVFDGIEVCRVQLPGRENRIAEAPFADFATFGEQTAEGLRPFLDRPYALFGHCTGALLAHALTTRLERLRVRAPARLFVSSSLAPHIPPGQRYRPPGPGAEGVYHPSMTDGELAAEMRRVARAQGQHEILPDLLPIALRVLRRDLEMCYSYAPGRCEPVGCPITAISWTRDPDAPPERMSVWAPYGAVRHHVLDGDKLSFIGAPQALLDIFAEDCLGTEYGSTG